MLAWHWLMTSARQCAGSARQRSRTSCAALMSARVRGSFIGPAHSRSAEKGSEIVSKSGENRFSARASGPRSQTEPPDSCWQPLKAFRSKVLEALADQPMTLRRVAHEVGQTEKNVAGECRQLIDAGLLVTIDGTTRLAADVVLSITVLGETELVRSQR